MISFHSIPLLIVSVLFLLLGVYVFAQRRGSPGNIGYVLWCYLTVHWHFTWAIIYSVNDLRTAELLNKIGYSGIIFLPIAYYDFAVSFVRKKNGNLRVLVPYLIGLAFLATIWMGNHFVVGVQKYWWGYFPNVGNWHPYYLCFLTYLCWDGLKVLSKEYRRETSILRKSQLKHVIVACACYMLAAIDFIANYGVPVYPFGFIFTFLSLLIVVRGISQHQLMGLSLVIRKTAIYSVVTASLTAIYFIIATQLAKLLEGVSGQANFWSAAVAAVVVTALFQPMMNRMRNLLDEKLFGDWLGDMSRGVVHEVKGPLASISLPAELTLMDLEDIEKGKQDIRALLPAMKERMRGILNKTGEAAERIEALYELAASRGPSAGAVSIHDIIQGGISAAKNVLGSANVPLVLDVPQGLPPVRGSVKQLEIAVGNLVKNAVEAMNGSHDPVRLSAYEDKKHIVLSVRDTGSGIGDQDQAHLFDPNFTTKGAKGMGLGLYLTEKIIREHGGTITVHSEVGKGTEFIVKLPKLSEKNSFAA